MSRRVLFQLDSPMSTQFAGVALALRQGLYRAAGVSVELLPGVSVGGELDVVVRRQQELGSDATLLGTTEQNILVPNVVAGHAVQGFAAMFGSSPLALAALPNRAPALAAALQERVDAAVMPLRVGAHADTIALLERLVPEGVKVVEVGREDKLEMLRAGSLDAVQIYDVMESLRLQRDLGAPPVVLRLAELGAELGYAQVLFAR